MNDDVVEILKSVFKLSSISEFHYFKLNLTNFLIDLHFMLSLEKINIEWTVLQEKSCQKNIV